MGEGALASTNPSPILRNPTIENALSRKQVERANAAWPGRATSERGGPLA
jgi:hypothetical protein